MGTIVHRCASQKGSALGSRPRAVALARPRAFQGASFALAGLWALVRFESFDAVILVLARGVVMLVAALRLRVACEVALWDREAPAPAGRSRRLGRAA